MSEYRPERWVIVELGVKGSEPERKILAGWSGSYLEGQSWKLSSGITKETEFEDRFEFDNYSGSKYICRKSSYGMNMIMMSVFDSFCKDFEGTKYVIKLVEDKKYEQDE